MTNVEMWSLVVGFLLPPVLAIIQQPKWPDAVRAVVTFLACVVAGLITVAVAGDLAFDNPEQWATSVLFVLVTAVATYKGFWKPTNIAPKIEGTTSSSPAGTQAA